MGESVNHAPDDENVSAQSSMGAIGRNGCEEEHPR
jgi:hypothetical protein